MRIVIITGLLAAALCQPLAAAPPVFAGGQTAAPAESKTSWGLPTFGRLFGKKSEPASVLNPPVKSQPVVQGQPVYGQPAPSTAARIKRVFTTNPFGSSSNAVTSPATTQPNDALALSRPAPQPTAEMLATMAGMAEQSGDTESARSLFQKALAAQPTNVQALRAYARLEDRQGRMTEAEKLYRQAVASNPGHAGALNDLALCYARQNKLQLSLGTLERAIQINPAKPLYRNNIAKVLVASGDKPRAVAHLAAVHGPVIAQYNVGQLLLTSGQEEKALSHFEQAVALDPTFEPATAVVARLSPTSVAEPAEQIASRPKLPVIVNGPAPAPAAQPVSAPATEQVQTPLPQLPTANSPATAAGPTFPQLLPPVTE